MSDFLTHLAARAIAQPTLRPRTRMRFEPQATEVASNAAEEGGERTSRPLEQEKETTSGRDVRSPLPLPQSVPPQVQTVERTRVEPRVQREIRRSVETRDRTTSERVIQPETTTIRERVPHRIEIEKPRVIATREEVEREVEVPTEPKIVREKQPRIIETRVQESAGQPDIHVTIGRVEVRAVTPQQQRRTPQRNGVMTLDEYAAKRKERR